MIKRRKIIYELTNSIFFLRYFSRFAVSSAHVYFEVTSIMFKVIYNCQLNLTFTLEFMLGKQLNDFFKIRYTIYYMHNNNKKHFRDFAEIFFSKIRLPPQNERIQKLFSKQL